MNFRRRPLFQALLGAPALLSQQAHAQAGRKVIRSVPIGDLRAFDPIWTTTYLTRNHAYLVWDTLFALDAQNRPQPQMVEAWQVAADGLSWTFTLRAGLLWHDGAPVTPADCVASIRRWGQKDGMGRALAAVTAGLEVVDARTFRLKLSRPVGFVLDALGKIDSAVPFMMPERLARTDANTSITEVIGSGPFVFRKEEWVPGVKVVYDRFDRYVPRAEPPSQAAGGKVVKVDRVESLYTPDAATQMSGLLTGEFDILESPSPDLVEAMARNADVSVVANDPLGYQLFIALNQTVAPFDNIKARHALLHGIHQPDFMQAVVGTKTPWRECAAMFGCYGDEGPQFQEMGWPAYDPARAAVLLREAGYDGRPVVVMDPADNSSLHPPALVLADAMKKMGINVDLQVMDWSALVQRRASKAPPSQGGWNAFITNATITGIGNPLLNTFARTCADAWFGWACDARMAPLMEAWTYETDPTKRQEVLKRIERLHIEAVTLAPLGQYRSLIAYRKSLKGVIPGPALFYWNVEKA